MKNSLAYKLIDKRIGEVHFKKGKGLLEKSRKTKIMGSEKKSENSKDSGYSKIGSERMFASRGLLQGKYQRDHMALSQAA